MISASVLFIAAMFMMSFTRRLKFNPLTVSQPDRMMQQGPIIPARASFPHVQMQDSPIWQSREEDAKWAWLTKLDDPTWLTKLDDPTWDAVAASVSEAPSSVGPTHGDNVVAKKAPAQLHAPRWGKTAIKLLDTARREQAKAVQLVKSLPFSPIRTSRSTILMQHGQPGGQYDVAQSPALALQPVHARSAAAVRAGAVRSAAAMMSEATRDPEADAEAEHNQASLLLESMRYLKTRKLYVELIESLIDGRIDEPQFDNEFYQVGKVNRDRNDLFREAWLDEIEDRSTILMQHGLPGVTKSEEFSALLSTLFPDFGAIEPSRDDYEISEDKMRNHAELVQQHMRALQQDEVDGISRERSRPVLDDWAQ